MTWRAIPALLTASLVAFIAQWFWLRRASRKERIACLSLLAMGWLLAGCLFLFPRMPGLTQMIDVLLGPLAQWLIGTGRPG